MYVVIGISTWELSLQITRRLLSIDRESLVSEVVPRQCTGSLQLREESERAQDKSATAHPSSGLRTEKEISCAPDSSHETRLFYKSMGEVGLLMQPAEPVNEENLFMSVL